MAGLADTFKPVNVAEEKDELGRPINRLEEELDGLTVPAPVPTPTELTGAVPVDEPASVLSQFVPVDDVSTEPTGGLPGFAPVEDAVGPEGEGYPSYYEGYSRLGEQMGADYLAAEEAAAKKEEERVEYVHKMLPEGIEPFSYSPDDLSDNDDLYNAILPYMEDRIGSEQIKEMDREDVVNKFLNKRRFITYSGNSIQNVREYDYLNDIEDDPEKLENAGRAYVVYQNMAGLTSDETSWGEAGEAVLDVVRGVALDPVTWGTFGVGKLAAGVTLKGSAHVVEQTLTRTVQAQLAKGISAEVVTKGAQVTVRESVRAAAAKQAADLAAFTARNEATVLQRFQTRAAWAEIGTTIAADTAVGTGVELLYQGQLVKTGVEDQVNRNSVALVALSSFSMGLISAGAVATRGYSGTALPSQTVKPGTGKEAADALRTSIGEYFSDFKKEIATGTSWESKVASGSELSVRDTDFFIDMLLGVSTKTDAGEEVTHLKGLMHTMQEQGFYFVKRDEDDKISNFVADFITKELDADDVAGIITTFEKSSGTKLTGFVDEAGEAITGTPTPEQFANAFASKINSQARGLNSVSQAANRLGIDLEDMDVEKYLEIAMGQRLIGKTKGDAFGERFTNTVTSTIAQNQNRYIRALVSHLSTTKLNVLGWGVSSGMGSASDLLRATGHLGLGQTQQMIGMSAAGATNKQIARALMGANANRINLLLDSDMTSAAFTSALERNSGALDRMNRTLTGGIDESLRTVGDIVDRTKLGTLADNYIDAAQSATLVRAQDTFTKSQEYVFQMDKALRLTFNKTWDEFYTAEDAGLIMASKQYKELEESVVGRVMTHTFSESFKGKTVLGEVAGVIEDARNIPGIGMMVPFGRFFNNTVAFTARNTPGVNNLVKLSGKFGDATHGELFANGIVAGGLVYSYAALAQDQRKQGLGMYEIIDENTGDVRVREYDYPLSLFMAVGHALSYAADGQEIPTEVIKSITVDFGISGLTRGLTTSSDNLSEAFKYLVAGELEKSGAKFGEAGGAVISQYAAGISRPLEGADTLVGVAAGIDMRPQNIKDGNLFIGKSLAYVDNTVQLFTGKPFNDPRVGSVTGEADVDTGKQFGSRATRLTRATRLMNLLEYDIWKEDASFRAMQMAPEAGNEYNRMFDEQIEAVAGQILVDEVFLQMPLNDQRALVESTFNSLRDQARMRLSYEYRGEQSTFAEQLKLTDKYTSDILHSTMEELEMGPTLGDLTDLEIDGLSKYLDTRDVIEAYERGGKRAWAQ